MPPNPSALAQTLHHVATKWPKDLVRPHIQMSAFLGALATHPRLNEEAVNKSQALLNNELWKKYPLSDKIMHPPSYPEHFDRLAMAFEKAAQGIGRPWWKIFLGIY